MRFHFNSAAVPRAMALALACAFAGAAPALAQDGALGTNVQGLLEYARAQSPELAAMRLEAEAAAQRVQPAGALPDPVLRVELMNVNNYGNEAGFSLLPNRVGETKYTLMQMLPAWGKRDLRRDVAEADVRQAQARSGATWAEVAMRIKSGYARYYLAANTERLTREILDLMARVEQVAQARYAGGLVAQQDAIRAQLEQTTMRSELIMIDAEKRQARARLNALLARDAAAPLAEPAALRPLPAVGALDAAALAQRARQNNPQLQAEAARLRGAEKNRELAQRNRYPDVTLGHLAQPDGLAHHDLGRDGGSEHPAAADHAPRTGSRGAGHGRRRALARRGAGAAVDRRPRRTARGAGSGAQHRGAGDEPVAAAVRIEPALGASPRTRTASSISPRCSKRSGRSARCGRTA